MINRLTSIPATKTTQLQLKRLAKASGCTVTAYLGQLVAAMSTDVFLSSPAAPVPPTPAQPVSDPVGEWRKD